MLSDIPDQILTVVLSTGIEQQKQLNHPLHLCLLWIDKILSPFSPLHQDSNTSKHSHLTTPVKQASKIGKIQPTHSPKIQRANRNPGIKFPLKQDKCRKQNLHLYSSQTQMSRYQQTHVISKTKELG